MHNPKLSQKTFNNLRRLKQEFKNDFSTRDWKQEIKIKFSSFNSSYFLFSSLDKFSVNMFFSIFLFIFFLVY